MAAPSTGAPTSASSIGGPLRHYQIIYPQYLDRDRTPKEGRRVAKHRAVPGPTLDEIYAAVHQLGFTKCYVEGSKHYSRAQSAINFSLPGRIRVEIKGPQEEHYVRKSEYDKQTRVVRNEDVPNKLALMNKVCDIINNLPRRKAAAEQEKHKKQRAQILPNSR